MDFLPIIAMPFEISGEKVAGTNDTAKPAPPDELNDNVIVFLNTSSGGRMGPKVLKKVGDMIPETQIFDLDDVKQKKWIPEDKLRQFENVGDIKVLICGGDGTMGWILSCIDRLVMSNDHSLPDGQKFPVAMMPLGTGNDLARSFGWGPGFSASMVRPKFIEKVKKAPSVKLDRWLLSVMPYTPLGDEEIIKNTNIPPTFSVHKYSSALSPFGKHFGLPQPQNHRENRRTQSVLRIGRSFSVRMSSVANAVHEQEMDLSSSVGHRSFHGLGPGAENENGGDSKEVEGMVRASSAPPVGERGISASALLTTPGYAALNENDDEDGDEESTNEDSAGEKAAAPSSAPPPRREEEAGTGETAAATGGEGKEEEDPQEAAAAMREDTSLTRKGPPRAMPSISVIQRYETWESYDAVFFNYFSFGVDAVAASAFHEFRKEYPQLFTSRLRNQTWYARKGFPAAGGVPCSGIDPPPLMSKYLKMNIKRTPGSEWESIEIDPNLRGMVVLNLQSYGGGRDLWGSAKPGCSKEQSAPAAPDDGLLEIVGVSSILELGCIMGFNGLGVGATRLCQVAEVELRMHSEIHMQIDGEPWLQAPAKVNIKHYGQSTCLRGPD